MNNKANVTDKVIFSKERLLSFFSIILISFLEYFAALYMFLYPQRKQHADVCFVFFSHAYRYVDVLYFRLLF